MTTLSNAFNISHPPLGAGRRLPDPVADLRDLVEGSVRAEAEVRPRHVVGDGGRQHDHGDAELLVLVPGLRQLKDRVEGLEAADEEDAMDVVLAQGRGDLFDSGWNLVKLINSHVLPDFLFLLISIVIQIQ